MISNKISKVIVDFRTDKIVVEALKNLGYDIIFTKKLNNVYEGLCGHADMQICKIGNLFVCEPSVYDYYKEFLGENLICGSSELICEYPADVRYNACVFGKNVILNPKYCDTELNRIFQNDAELNLISVKQGYAKCSTAVVADNAIITSDDGIYKAALNNKIEALKIEKGYIKLEGFDYGFIGGATGLIEKNILAVCGSIKHHPSYNEIKAFCRGFGVDLAELSDKPCTDIGSIIKI